MKVDFCCVDGRLPRYVAIEWFDRSNVELADQYECKSIRIAKSFFIDVKGALFIDHSKVSLVWEVLEPADGSVSVEITES